MKLSLKTEVGIIEFILDKTYQEEGFFDFFMKCNLDNKFSDFLPNIPSCRLYRSDLTKLVNYFQEHCLGLESGRLFESPTYMPLEADFQIRCLDGDIENGEGYFSVNVLFNYGKVSESGTNCYFGFESVIDLDDLNIFYDEVEKIVNSIS